MSFVPSDVLERIEREHQGGIQAAQVVQIFQERGVRLSQATFRKYVQVGLLPRSRRVGRKGKHRGSGGLYPISVVRRVDAIKSMMAEGMTLEDIRESFLVVRGEIDAASAQFDLVLSHLDQALRTRPLSAVERTRLSAELRRLKEEGSRLTSRLERIGSRIAARRHLPSETRSLPEGA